MTQLVDTPATPVPPPPADDDGPVTVPIRLKRQSSGTTAEMKPADVERASPNKAAATLATPLAEVMTPSVRVPVRTATREMGSSAKLLVSPARRVLPSTAEPLADGSKPRLRVLRGQKVNVEYPLYEGENVLGRRDDDPIDVDLDDQEPADRVWTSRRHAIVHLQDGLLEVEDLNSLNGTFINRTRVPPGQRRALTINDIIQVGTIQLRVLA